MLANTKIDKNALATSGTERLPSPPTQADVQSDVKMELRNAVGSSAACQEAGQEDGEDRNRNSTLPSPQHWHTQYGREQQVISWSEHFVQYDWWQHAPYFVGPGVLTELTWRCQ